jgi:ankyrin repeat protein
VQNKEGSTPLHLAASEGVTSITELLLDRGANIQVQNNEGQTPLQVASQSVKHLLLERMQSAQDVH